MKKTGKILVGVIALFAFSSNVKADSYSSEIKCSTDDEYTAVCKLTFQTDQEGIYGFQAGIELSSNLKLSEQSKADPAWQGGFANNSIGVYAADVVKTQDIATIILKGTEPIKNGDTITLKNVKITAINDETINVEDSVQIELSAFEKEDNGDFSIGDFDPKNPPQEEEPKTNEEKKDDVKNPNTGKIICVGGFVLIISVLYFSKARITKKYFRI